MSIEAKANEPIASEGKPSYWKAMQVKIVQEKPMQL
jgi:hypothetical protein